MDRKYNFSAGPAVLPQWVIEQLVIATTNFKGSGLGLLEMSHRSTPVVDMVNETTRLVRSILSIPDHYDICWLQGGASTQFAMIPMNFLSEEMTADYAETGAWSAKAIKEAMRFGEINICSSSKNSNYTFIPKKLNQKLESTYLHITSNNTIYGTQYKVYPQVKNKGGFLVADMSSDIFSREIPLEAFGLIYAGAQKNMGPAGVTIVIIRHDLLDQINNNVATMFDYRTHIEKQSMFNTPPVYAIYAVNRTLHWIQQLGGIKTMEEMNSKKAELLYREIERNSIFKSPVNIDDRSLMNVPFVFERNGDDSRFLSFCESRGLVTLKGHRSVGGFRASIYNAMPIEGIHRLVEAMQDYEKEN